MLWIISWTTLLFLVYIFYGRLRLFKIWIIWCFCNILKPFLPVLVCYEYDQIHSPSCVVCWRKENLFSKRMKRVVKIFFLMYVLWLNCSVLLQAYSWWRFNNARIKESFCRCICLFGIFCVFDLFDSCRLIVWGTYLFPVVDCLLKFFSFY